MPAGILVSAGSISVQVLGSVHHIFSLYLVSRCPTSHSISGSWLRINSKLTFDASFRIQSSWLSNFHMAKNLKGGCTPPEIEDTNPTWPFAIPSSYRTNS